MADDVKTGIVITGDAKGAVGALKSVQTESAKLQASTGALKDQVGGLPEKFSKSGAALLLFQGQMSQMGGRVAEVGTKLADVAGLVATGGILGVAFAGFTAALAAGSIVMEAYTAETRNLENAMASVGRIFDESTRKLREHEDTLRSLEKQVENFGKTARQVQIDEVKQRIALSEQFRGSVEEEIAAGWRQAQQLEARANQLTAIRKLELGRNELTRAEVNAIADEQEALRQQAQLLQVTATAQEEGLRRRAKRLETDKEILGNLEQLEQKEEQQVRRQMRRTRIRQQQVEEERKAAQAQRESERLEKERHRAMMARAREQLQVSRRRRELARQEAAEREAIEKQLLARQEAARAEAHQAQLQRAAQFESVMLSSIRIISNTEATAAAKTRDFMKMLGQMVIQFAVKRIAAAAAGAAAKAGEKSIEQYGIPYGLIIGGAAAAAAFAAVIAWQQKLNDGGFVRNQPSGFVTGGVRGRDSTNVLATPGEYVASTGEVGGFMKFASRLVGNEKAKQMAGMAGMTGPTRQKPPVENRTTIINNRMWVPNRTEEMKMSRRLAERTSTRMQRLGIRGATA